LRLIRVPQFLFVFFSFSVVYSQVSTENKEQIEEIKMLLQENHSKFEAESELNATQNELLKKKEKAKIEAELKLVTSDRIIVSGVLYEKVNRIFNQIILANPQIPQNTRMVLYRSNDFNAFTMGDNVIFVHIGLFSSLQNESQIALVISHEIAHNVLRHVRKSMVESVIRETDKEINKEVNSILKSDYGQVSALNALLVPRIMESREKSRQHEFEADSLGLVFLKNTAFDIRQALSLFHAMEKQKRNETKTIAYHKCFHIHELNSIAEKDAEYIRESSLGSFTKDESKLPYLATHPYERQRFYRLAGQVQADTTFATYLPTYDDNFKLIEKNVDFELIINSWKNKNLSEVIYHAIKFIETHPENSEGKEHLAMAFRVLAFLKSKRLAGKYLQLQNTKFPEDFDRVCALVNEISPDESLELFKRNKGNSDISDNHLSILASFIQSIEVEDYAYFEILWKDNKDFIHSSYYSFILTEMERYLYNTKKLLFLKPKQ